MKTKTVFSLLAISLLLISLSGVIHSVKAESTDFLSFSSGITLFSPINTTYTSRNLMLNLTLYSAGGFGSIDSRISLTYSIDSGEKFAAHLNVSNPGTHLITNGEEQIRLPKLSEGSHCLTLNLYGYNQRTYEPKFISYVNRVYFTIDSNVDLTPPKVTIFSPENLTYSTVDIPLKFTLDEQTKSSSYCLDENNSTMINGNSTLTGLSVGKHNLTISAIDAAGNVGRSETVQFAIITPAPTLLPPTNFLSLIIVIGILVTLVIVFVLAVLVYNKKHKPQK